LLSHFSTDWSLSPQGLKHVKQVNYKSSSFCGMNNIFFTFTSNKVKSNSEKLEKPFLLKKYYTVILQLVEL